MSQLAAYWNSRRPNQTFQSAILRAVPLFQCNGTFTSYKNPTMHHRNQEASLCSLCFPRWLTDEHGRRLISPLVMPWYLHAPGVALWGHYLLIGPCKCEVVAAAIGLLQEERGTAAADFTMGDNGDAIAQNVRLVHVVRRQNDGTAWGGDTNK